MEGEGYISAADFVARQGGLAHAVQAILGWRTAEWSDRSVAVAVLIIQLHGFPVRPHGRNLKGKVASGRRISQFLGYTARTPLVVRAIKRLMKHGWVRPVGRTGPGRRRVFDLWAGTGRPAVQMAPAERPVQSSKPSDPLEAYVAGIRAGRRTRPAEHIADLFVELARLRERRRPVQLAAQDDALPFPALPAR